MSKLTIGIIYAIMAQVLTYFQLQGNIKWNWYERYPIIVYLFSLPLTFLYIKSVEYFVQSFNGQVWPARLIGFSIGMIVFTILTEIFFKEPITTKTIITFCLSVCIILIQIFWK
jgi:hypothetical protein